MRRTDSQRLALSALFLGLGLALPFLTGQIPQIGQALLPMHIPALLCGFVCGWQWGLPVGFVMPLLRSVLFGMPPLFPGAAAMAFELAAYGAAAGLLYARLPARPYRPLLALLGAMIAGRLVWGLVSALLYPLALKSFTFPLFLAGAVINAIPGIVLQLVLIPAILMALERAGLLPLKTATKKG